MTYTIEQNGHTYQLDFTDVQAVKEFCDEQAGLTHCNFTERVIKIL
jgi:hypothetical protein